MRRTLAAAAIAALSFTLPAQAETIDLATVKCSELATMDQESATFMFTWLLGYSSGQAGTTTMDLAAMGEVGPRSASIAAPTRMWGYSRPQPPSWESKNRPEKRTGRPAGGPSHTGRLAAERSVRPDNRVNMPGKPSLPAIPTFTCSLWLCTMRT